MATQRGKKSTRCRCHCVSICIEIHSKPFHNWFLFVGCGCKEFSQFSPLLGVQSLSLEASAIFPSSHFIFFPSIFYIFCLFFLFLWIFFFIFLPSFLICLYFSYFFLFFSFFPPQFPFFIAIFPLSLSLPPSLSLPFVCQNYLSFIASFLSLFFLYYFLRLFTFFLFPLVPFIILFYFLLHHFQDLFIIFSSYFHFGF